MPDDYMEGEHEAVERRSSVATEDLEYEPLLGNGVGPSLYKTLSVSNCLSNDDNYTKIDDIVACEHQVGGSRLLRG